MRRRLILTALLVATPGLALADCQSDFDAMLHGNLNIISYRILGRIEVSDGSKTEVTTTDLSVRQPDALIMTIEKPSGFNSGLVTAATKKDFAIIDAKGQVRADNGDWHSVPAALVEEMLKTVTEAGFATKSAGNPECLGQQKADGKDFTVYRFTDKNGLMTMYVDPKTSLPAFAEGVATGPNAKAKVSMKYTYGDDVKIELPK